jgi:hypothetical protein
MQCTARRKSGVPCHNYAVQGRDKCRMHGGTNPGGPITSGRYSKFLPRRLAADYDRARKDSELLSVRDGMAVLEARLCELLKSVDAEESAIAWGKALRLYEVWGKGEPAKALEAWEELGEVLRHGLGEAVKWREIQSLIEQQRKNSETEAKRLTQMQQMLSAEQANVLMAALLRAVEFHVSDAGIRRRVAEEFIRLAGPRDLPAALGNGSGCPEP